MPTGTPGHYVLHPSRLLNYSVYGLTVRSDVSLPDAALSDDGAADCVITTRADVAPAFPGRQVGDELVVTGVYVRSFEHQGRYRLEFDDTGTFDINQTGDAVTWWSGGREPGEAVQIDILGRVLAMVLHTRGILTLHASAVDIGGDGIAFLAPKFYGKSTLATALVHAGARVIADDSAAVELGSPPRLLPGIQSLRLRADSAERIRVEGTESYNNKLRFRPGLNAMVGRSPTPLTVIYLLRPEPPSPGAPAVLREPCAESQAVLAIVSSRKLGSLLTGAVGAPTFDSSVTLARTVPIYWLRIARDLTRIDEATRALTEWHGASSPTTERDGDHAPAEPAHLRTAP